MSEVDEDETDYSCDAASGSCAPLQQLVDVISDEQVAFARSRRVLLDYQNYLAKSSISAFQAARQTHTSPDVAESQVTG